MEDRSFPGLNTERICLITLLGVIRGEYVVSPRIKKGLQWAKSVLYFVIILAGVKVFFALGSADPGKNLAIAIILFLSWCILLCPLAFILGWLTGSKGKSESDEFSD